MKRRSSLILAFLIPVVTASCGDQAPPVPASVAVTALTTLLESLGETTQLSAVVKTKKGKVMSGVTVTWSSSNAQVAQVTSSGMVTAQGNGTASITATADGAMGSVSITVTQAPAALQKVEGDQQTGTVGETLDGQVTVRVNDARSNPIANATLSFGVQSGGGSSSVTTATTDQAGQAGTQWELGTDASADQILRASIGSLSVEFTASAVAGPAVALGSASGNEQTGEALRPLAESLVALVADAFGNPVQGTTVRWEVDDGSGALDPEEGVTGPDGTASTNWTLGPWVGDVLARALVEGLETLVFQATSISPPLGEILVSPNPLAMEVGEQGQMSASASDTDGAEILGLDYSWSSSAPEVATVSESGLVTAVGVGTAIISAAAEGVQGASAVTVFALGQKPGVSLNAPGTAFVNQNLQVQLRVNPVGLGQQVGAVSVRIEWDPAVLNLGAWGGFSSTYSWWAVRWTTSGRLATVVSIPTGIQTNQTLLTFPMTVVGGSGTQTTISLSLEQAVSALTFVELANQLSAQGLQITIQ
jgi:hypothetical protein